jgi:hypothetical protein
MNYNDNILHSAWVTGFIDGFFQFFLSILYKFEGTIKIMKYFITNNNLNRNINMQNYTTINYNNSCTSLIVWGDIMGSGVGFGRISFIIQSMYSFTYFQHSVLIGCLLSDAWLSFSNSNSKNARLGFTQSLAHFNYFWLVFNILAPFISNFPYLRIRSRNNSNIFQSSMEFLTRSLPCFTNLHSLFYINGIKIVPVDIFHYLNSIALAHWIMGDGNYRKGGGLTLCTDSFTLKEVILLMNVLIIKYDLKCSLHQRAPNSYRIYISKSSICNLQVLVLPYMVPSMLYKIHL